MLVYESIDYFLNEEFDYINTEEQDLINKFSELASEYGFVKYVPKMKFYNAITIAGFALDRYDIKLIKDKIKKKLHVLFLNKDDMDNYIDFPITRWINDPNIWKKTMEY